MRSFICLSSLLLLALPTDGLNLPPGWWCGDKPCLARRTETRDSHSHMEHTTAAGMTVNKTTTNNRFHSNGPQAQPTKWWCDTHPCSATTKERRDNQIHNTTVADITIDNVTTNTTVPDDDPQRGWVCHGRICPPKLKVIKNRQINDTGLNNTTTNVTSSNQAGHRRITPAIVWWCNTHVCPSNMRTAGKRETDSSASEGSISS